MVSKMWAYRKKTFLNDPEARPKYNKYISGQVLKSTAKCREVLYDILGGKLCSCLGVDCWHDKKCSVVDMRCLQFDHKLRIGLRDEKRKRFITGSNMYCYYSKRPDEARRIYQVLCANCNWVKRHRNKEHGFTFNESNTIKREKS